MREILVCISAIEVLCAVAMLFICITKHTHQNIYNERFKLAVVLCACVGVLLGLTMDTELSLTGAGLFELIFVYILHTLYLQDFEPRRTYPDETP